MIITCEECFTQFNLGKTAIPDGGRKVRCANCGHIWHQDKTQTAQQEINNDNIADETTEPKTKKEKKETDSESEQKEIIGINNQENLASEDNQTDYSHIESNNDATEKNDENDSSPNQSQYITTQKKYQLLKPLIITLILFITTTTLGLIANGSYPHIFGTQNLNGLVFNNFSVKKEIQDNGLRFLINGKITNQSEQILTIPDIRITILSKGDRKMGSIVYPMSKLQLEAGESTTITPEIISSGNAHHIILDIGNKLELFLR